MRIEGQRCIRYVPRDLNQVVDCMTKLSLIEELSFQVYNSAPFEILELIQQDKANDISIQFI